MNPTHPGRDGGSRATWRPDARPLTVRSLLGAMGIAAVVLGGAAAGRLGLEDRAAAQRAPASVTIGWDDAGKAAARRWIAARVRAARAGNADLVEIPLAVASLGWGCVCPTHYVGSDPDTEGVAWLDLVDEGAGIPEQSRAGHVLMVSGYFDGNVSHFDWHDDQRLLRRYLQYGFVAKSIVRRQADETPRARVVRPRALTCTTVVSDDTPLRVRQGAGMRAAVVGEVPTDATVTAVDVRDVWVRISAPLGGWVHGTKLRTRCE